jgi:hypothetical protein
MLLWARWKYLVSLQFPKWISAIRYFVCWAWRVGMCRGGGGWRGLVKIKMNVLAGVGVSNENILADSH